MYPKTTFYKKEKEQSSKNNTNREFIKSKNLDYSHLILHDDNGSIYQSFDIDMPYLILYESINLQNNQSVYQEYSENNQVLFSNTYESLVGAVRKPHSHNFYELTFVLSGELTLRIENEDVFYRQGDCCLCNKNIHHLELMDKNTEVVLFLIKEDYIHNVCDTNFFYDRKGMPHSLGTIFDVFFTENQKNPLYDAKIYSDFRMTDEKFLSLAIGLINQMIEEISGSQSGKSHMMKALFCRFFEMLQNPDIYDVNVHWAKLSNDEQIIFKIADAYKKKMGIFTREEIERITGYNGDYVERIIKRATGKTLSEYGREFLVQHAADLLLTTDKNVGEICDELGYSNRHYFNQIFKKKYGITPSGFRKL